jgi:hypothetical protein
MRTSGGRAAIDRTARVSYPLGHGVAPQPLLDRFIPFLHLQLCRAV